MGSFLKRRVEPRAGSRYYYSGGGYKQAMSSGVEARPDQLYRVEFTPTGPKLLTEPPRVPQPAHVETYNISWKVIKDFKDMVNRLQGCGEVSFTRNDSRKPSFPTICQVIYTFTPSNRTTDFEKNLTARLISWKENFHRVVKESSSAGYSMDIEKLGQALKLIGCNISKPDEVDLMSMFHTSDGRRNEPAMSYDEFIQCCAFVQRYLVEDSSSASARNLLTTSSPSPSTTSSPSLSTTSRSTISSTSSPTTPSPTTSASLSINPRAKT